MGRHPGHLVDVRHHGGWDKGCRCYLGYTYIAKWLASCVSEWFMLRMLHALHTVHIVARKKRNKKQTTEKYSQNNNLEK